MGNDQNFNRSDRVVVLGNDQISHKPKSDIIFVRNDLPSHRPDSEFIKVRGAIYNKKYIKYIVCNDNKCSLIMANTRSGYTRTFKKSFENDKIFEDELFECDKFREPDCYNSLKDAINNYN